jgi:hypothetical protein
VAKLETQSVTDAEASDARWKKLYQIAGAAALITVAFIPIQIVVFLAWPPPGYEPTSAAVIGWFALFHKNRLVGLLAMDLLLIVDEALAIPIALALYLALRRANESLMLVATTLSMTAIAAYFASNTAVSMLSLSGQYAAATTEAEKSLLVGAGQVLMAIYTGTAFHLSYVLGSVALLMVSTVMLRSNVFSKATAYAGILASVIGLGLYVPKIGLYLSILSVPFIAIWDILLGRRFFRLARGKETAHPA